VKEERQYGWNDVLSAFVAHGKQLDGLDDGLRDCGNCKKLTRLRDVGLYNLHLAFLVGNNLRHAW
jgi:hypothetical protein